MPSRFADLLAQTPPDVRPDDLPGLRHTGMGAWVASRLPPEHPQRPALEPGRLGMLARQMLLRRALLPLLRACHEAGVQSVLLKGFMLAEFAYPVPGTRPYGDVDLLILPAQLPLLLSVAAEQGWREDGMAADPALWTHEIAHLHSPDGQVRLDVHRYVTGWTAGSAFQAGRLTRAMWQASETELLGGVPVGRPSWPDCAMQLVLGRSWTEDRGVYKPADYTDLEVLARRPGVTRAHLDRRARQLGARHTWRAFAAGCDPWRGHFEYGNPARAARIRRAALLDGSAWALLSRFKRVLRGPRLLWRMGRALPDVLAAGWNLRQAGADPRARARQMAATAPQGGPGETPALGAARVASVVHGVRWLTRLLYPRSAGVCVPRSLATYRALRRRGYPAVYVSGVRRGPDGAIVGHAWVEGPDGPLEAYGEDSNRQLYRTLFEER